MVAVDGLMLTVAVPVAAFAAGTEKPKAISSANGPIHIPCFDFRTVATPFSQNSPRRYGWTGASAQGHHADTRSDRQ